MNVAKTPLANLTEVAKDLREAFPKISSILLYAYNGTGKTRLSSEFKNLGRKVNQDNETIQRDTLYFNAFTEDLFSWHNDIVNDGERYLMLHPSSKFFGCFDHYDDMDNRIRPLFKHYTDLQFKFETVVLKNEDGDEIGKQYLVRFFRNVGGTVADSIKISRSEENLFIWCFFLAVSQLAIDDEHGTDPYNWVKYIYIDDPISSLDENNAVAVASHLVQILANAKKMPKVVISTHHTLFFNVLCNEQKKYKIKNIKRHLKQDEDSGGYILTDTSDKPFLHHLATLAELNNVQASGDIKRNHFNMMRCIMEQTSIFLGLNGWSDCLDGINDELKIKLYKRMIDVTSHGDYLINEPEDVNDKFKDDFRKIFQHFISKYPFKTALVQK